MLLNHSVGFNFVVNLGVFTGKSKRYSYLRTGIPHLINSARSQYAVACSVAERVLISLQDRCNKKMDTLSLSSKGSMDSVASETVY